jgi:thiol-disulfide isomerase/thioredoxin
MLNRRRTMSRTLVIALLAASAMGGKAAQTPTPNPDVKAIDGPGLKRAIAAQRGKVVLLNLWATWCQPCVAEFPDLVKLQNNYRSRGLVVIAAALDDPETQSKVKPFLASQKATFPAYLRKPGDVDAFVSPVDRSWSGAVPTSYLFDRKGRMVGKPLIGAHSYTQLAGAVEPLLR